MNVEIRYKGKTVHSTDELPVKFIRDVMRDSGYEIYVDGELFEEGESGNEA